MLAIIFLVSFFSLLKRRLADRDHGVIYMILSFVFTATFLSLIEAFFLKGTQGPNRFGPAPSSNKSEKNIAYENDYARFAGQEHIPTVVSMRKPPKNTRI